MNFSWYNSKSFYLEEQLPPINYTTATMKRVHKTNSHGFTNKVQSYQIVKQNKNMTENYEIFTNITYTQIQRKDHQIQYTLLLWCSRLHEGFGKISNQEQNKI